MRLPIADSPPEESKRLKQKNIPNPSRACSGIGNHAVVVIYRPEYLDDVEEIIEVCC